MGLLTMEALREFELALERERRQKALLSQLRRRAEALVVAAMRRLGLQVYVPVWDWPGAGTAQVMRVAGGWVIQADLAWLAAQERRSGPGAFQNPLLHEVGHIAIRELGLLPPSQHADELTADRAAAAVAEWLCLDHAGAEAILAQTGGCDDPRICTHPSGQRRVAEYRRTWIGFRLR